MTLQAANADEKKVAAELRQRLAAAEQACHDRDQTIARCKEAMGQENGQAAFMSAMQSPQVAARSSGREPLSPVQAYSKYVSVMQERDKLKKDLENQTAEWEQVHTSDYDRLAWRMILLCAGWCLGCLELCQDKLHQIYPVAA